MKTSKGTVNTRQICILICWQLNFFDIFGECFKISPTLGRALLYFERSSKYISVKESNNNKVKSRNITTFRPIKTPSVFNLLAQNIQRN